MGITINLLDKILLGIIAVLIIFGLTMYIKNENLHKEIVRKQDSLYVSTQNQAAFKSQLSLKADTIQTTALFVKSLQTELSKSKNQYNILNNQFTTAKTEWEIFKKTHASISDDSVTIAVNEYHKPTKTTVSGYTAFYPKASLTSNAAVKLKITNDPFTYKTRTYYDTMSKLMMSDVYADGQLISMTKTEMDSSVFLLIKKNEPQIPEDTPGFLDNLFFGGYTGVYNENISDFKTLSNYSLYGGLYTGYSFDKLTLTFSKSIGDRSFSVGLDYWFSAREILKSIFK